MRWLPWLLATGWFGFRWIAGAYTGYDLERGRQAGVLANILLILVVVFATLVVRHRKGLSRSTGFLQEVRACLGAALRYCIGVCMAMFLYYGPASPELEARRVADRKANAALVQDPEKLEALKQVNPALRELDAAAILESANARTDLMTSKSLVISASFIGLIMAGILYALIGTFLFRNFLSS